MREHFIPKIKRKAESGRDSQYIIIMMYGRTVIRRKVKIERGSYNNGNYGPFIFVVHRKYLPALLFFPSSPSSTHKEIERIDAPRA